MLRVGWTVAGWAPGVRRMLNRVRFHWITGSSARAAGARARALAATTAAVSCRLRDKRSPSSFGSEPGRPLRHLLGSIVDDGDRVAILPGTTRSTRASREAARRSLR